jgi:hypothetical protein
MSDPVRDTRADILSFGGGTQTCAMIELVLQGRLPRPERIVMADTGREATETWEYAQANVIPRLAHHGMKLESAPHGLATVDLLAKNGDILMPVYTADGKGQLPSYCSNEWKKRVIQRYLRQFGYGPKKPVRLWLGISTDELHRAGASGVPWCENHHPLLFDVPMNREECRRLLVNAGWPEPPKSSCWMCPYRGNAQWRRLRDHFPGDFAKAVALDATLRETDANTFVHRSGVPLAEANLDTDGKDQMNLFTLECDSGYCFV